MVLNNKRRKKITVVVRLGFILCLFMACDGGTSISGHVRDVSGKSIEGAKVALNADDRTNVGETSRADGYYQTSIMHAPYKDVQVKLTVSKEGFKTYEQTFLSGEASKQKTYDVVLEPLSSPGAKAK
jgi:hypothetical protein